MLSIYVTVQRICLHPMYVQQFYSFSNEIFLVCIILLFQLQEFSNKISVISFSSRTSLRYKMMHSRTTLDECEIFHNSLFGALVSQSGRHRSSVICRYLFFKTLFFKHYCDKKLWLQHWPSKNVWNFFLMSRILGKIVIFYHYWR